MLAYLFLLVVCEKVVLESDEKRLHSPIRLTCFYVVWMNIRFTDFATSFSNMYMYFVSARMKCYRFLALYMHFLPIIYFDGQTKIVFVFHLFI